MVTGNASSAVELLLGQGDRRHWLGRALLQYVGQIDALVRRDDQPPDRPGDLHFADVQPIGLQRQ